MKFVQIPHIESAWDNVVIKTLSPSTFSWVSRGCGYQVLLQKVLSAFNNSTLSLPPNRNAILGTIIHKIYELTQKGELQNLSDLKKKWEELVVSEKNKLADNYPTLRNAIINDYDKRNSAIRYALGIMKKTIKNLLSESVKVYLEKRLDCGELGLRGVADKLIIDDEYIDIVDFKSGHVKDENGEIKTEYQIQLQLYAVMCQHLSLGKPRSLCLVDIEGEYFEVPYSPDFSKQLLDEVKSTLEMLNGTILNRSFQTLVKPDLGLCSRCSCRHICQYRNISPDFYYQTITGKVIEVPSTNLYALQSFGNTIYVSGLDVYQVESPQDYLGRTLVFVNVARASQLADDFTYKISENTLVYEQL